MIVVLFDRSQIIVGKEQGERLKQSMMSNGNEGMIDLNGTLIKRSAIAVIKPGGYSEADMVERKLLDQPEPRRQVGKIAKSASSIGGLLEDRNGAA